MKKLAIIAAVGIVGMSQTACDWVNNPDPLAYMRSRIIYACKGGQVIMKDTKTGKLSISTNTGIVSYLPDGATNPADYCD